MPLSRSLLIPGVMVSHRNVVSGVVLQAAIEGPHLDWKKDRTLAVLPTYHIYGKYAYYSINANERPDLSRPPSCLAWNVNNLHGKV